MQDYKRWLGEWNDHLLNSNCHIFHTLISIVLPSVEKTVLLLWLNHMPFQLKRQFLKFCEEFSRNIYQSVVDLWHSKDENILNPSWCKALSRLSFSTMYCSLQFKFCVSLRNSLNCGTSETITTWLWWSNF